MRSNNFNSLCKGLKGARALYIKKVNDREQNVEESD
jgi:hypothetical protein